MAFDLDSLAAVDTFALHLKHPLSEELLYDDNEKTLPVQIVIHGPSSTQYIEAVTAMQNRELKRQREKKLKSAEQIKSEGIDLLVACSDHAVNLEYKQAPLDNPEAFRRLYSDTKLGWIKDAVDAAIGDMANFLGQ